MGRATGIVGLGATNSYQRRTGPEINIAPNANGSYIITYQFLVFFVGENAYSAFCNGVNVWPDAGWRYGSVSWDPGIDPTQFYDCLNGGCVSKTTYNTPGVFASLAACQSGCAKNSNCTGECVSAEEIAALQQAANKLQSRLCK